MDTKKLAKVIKIIVEHELKKQLPKLVNEGVKKALNEQTRVTQNPKPQVIENDPFEMANSVLEESRISTPQVEQQPLKRYSSNPVLNDILNNTKPFSVKGDVSSFGTPTPVNEDFNDMDKTLSFDTNIAQGGVEAVRAKMATKMGYGNTTNPNNPKSGGLGITTGLPGLDKILNRDNTELVKRFKTR